MAERPPSEGERLIGSCNCCRIAVKDIANRDEETCLRVDWERGLVGGQTINGLMDGKVREFVVHGHHIRVMRSGDCWQVSVDGMWLEGDFSSAEEAWSRGVDECESRSAVGPAHNDRKQDDD